MIDIGKVTIVAAWASCLDGVCVVGSMDSDWKRFPENIGFCFVNLFYIDLCT